MRPSPGEKNSSLPSRSMRTETSGLPRAQRSAACTQAEEPVVMEQPVSFYYRTAETDFSSEDGVIRADAKL